MGFDCGYGYGFDCGYDYGCDVCDGGVRCFDSFVDRDSDYDYDYDEANDCGDVRDCEIVCVLWYLPEQRAQRVLRGW
jgi:hypothetical protein